MFVMQYRVIQIIWKDSAQVWLGGKPCHAHHELNFRDSIFPLLNVCIAQFQICSVFEQGISQTAYVSKKHPESAKSSVRGGMYVCWTFRSQLLVHTLCSSEKIRTSNLKKLLQKLESLFLTGSCFNCRESHWSTVMSALVLPHSCHSPVRPFKLNGINGTKPEWVGLN